MQAWRETLTIYRHPKIITIIFLGFSSGLPFLLTLATLHAWLSEAGINKTMIGLFVIVTIPYSLKFIWAPLIDNLQVPLLCRLLGKRRGWLLTTQLGLMLSLGLLGFTDPHQNIYVTAIAALLVAFASATQDSVIDAYRVEILKPHQMGPGAGASSLGYRLGIWVSGAGALYLASRWDWTTVYWIMAACMIVGLITTFLASEPEINSQLQTCLETVNHPSATAWHQLSTWFSTSFTVIIQRTDIIVILLFIFFYKVGDTVLNTMTMPFLLELGFNKLEIAHVAKSFGIGTMIVGSMIGGGYLIRGSLSTALIVVAILQIFASIMFWVQAHVGYDITMLFITIGVENFSCGLGNAAFIVFLSSRCRIPHTATHFALLTSFGSFCRVSLSSLAGFMADQVTWAEFYSGAAILCLPLLILIISHRHAFEYKTESAGTLKSCA